MTEKGLFPACCGYGVMYDGARHTDDCKTPTLPHEVLAASNGTATGGYIYGPGSANDDTIPVFLSRGCAYIYGGRGHISQETLDALNATSTVVFSNDEED